MSVRVNLDILSIDKTKETIEYLEKRLERLEKEKNEFKREKWEAFVKAGIDYLNSTNDTIITTFGSSRGVEILNAEDWKMFTERVGCIDINYC